MAEEVKKEEVKNNPTEVKKDETPSNIKLGTETNKTLEPKKEIGTKNQQNIKKDEKPSNVKKEIEINKAEDQQDKPKTRKELEIEETLKVIEEDRKEKGNLQRFGYFSIPYPQTYGDQAYSQNQEYHHKVVDRKVITENRGVYTQGPKSGKGNDVYFPPPELPEKWVDRIEKDNKLRQEKEKQKIENEKKEKLKLKEKYPFAFKPAGPQIAFSFYKKMENEKALPQPDGPLTKEIDKKIYKIDHFKVRTKQRNIQAAPTRTGNNPSDYFDFYRVDENLQNKLEEMNKQDAIDKIEKVKQSKTAPPKIEFKPASLKLCEPFVNDKATFQLHNDKEMEGLLVKYKEDKKKGNQRYVKPPNPTKHDKPFSPANMVYNGRSGLFMYKSEDYYLNKDIRYTKEFQKEKKAKEEKEIKIPIREIREKENQEFKVKYGKPFTYNRLMKSSTFAPPISSYMVNIKRDFPTIKFH